MDKHTKEPWRLGKASDAVVAAVPPDVNPDDPAILYYGGHLICESASEANRRRIIACVNACQGIHTDYLESLVSEGGSISFEVMRRVAQRDDAVKQRDELLTALKKVLEAPSETLSDAKALREIVRIARAAIAKAESR